MDVIRQSHLETNNETGRRVMPLKEQKNFLYWFYPRFFATVVYNIKNDKSGGLYLNFS